MQDSLLSYGKIGKALLSKGFGFVKVELEANLVAGPGPCTRCQGRGTLDCPNCGGQSGSLRCPGGCVNGRIYTARQVIQVVTRNGDITYAAPLVMEYIECPFCGGQPVTCPACSDPFAMRCPGCGGAGRTTGLPLGTDEFDAAYRNEVREYLDTGRITYLRTYHDGSVSTEVTLTVRSRDCEAIPGLIAAFHRVASRLAGTQSYDVRNAGMHITLMETGDYCNLRELPELKIANFRRQMDKLVGCLFLLSSRDGKTTRSCYFRRGRVAYADKYSAIYTHEDRCIEYRVFDTCYREPERVRQFLAVIVRTLRYYDEHRLIPDGSLAPHRIREMSTNERCQQKLATCFGKPGVIDGVISQLEHVYPDKRKLTEAKKSLREGTMDSAACVEFLATI